jgi:hypothetical protein
MPATLIAFAISVLVTVYLDNQILLGRAGSWQEVVAVPKLSVVRQTGA